FTERQVQAWYMKNFFNGSSPFCFMRGGEEPGDNTHYITLDDLISHNGIGSPFSLPYNIVPHEEIRAQAEQ
ncbi:hypothetical protein PMAYCL1PPCAC_22394, partial [Pristionchus mayeri]